MSGRPLASLLSGPAKVGHASQTHLFKRLELHISWVKNGLSGAHEVHGGSLDDDRRGLLMSWCWSKYFMQLTEPFKVDSRSGVTKKLY